MKYIANIVTNNKIDVSSFFNITSDYDSIDTSLPTLIIGWALVKDIFPEQNILCSKISDNTYWTFSKREKRFQYEMDILKFTNYVIQELEKKVNYHFFNYILADKERCEKFIDYVNCGNCSVYYNSRFVYIYCSSNLITIGVSLKDIIYIGISPNDFIKSLNKNNNNIICNNLSFIDENSFSLIKENIKAVAYLNYLKNSDIYKEKDCNDKNYYQTSKAIGNYAY